MSLINEVISIMRPPEKRSFIKHLVLRNKRHDTRNIALFKSILENREGEIRQEIGNNAFNVLKKRLFDRILDFMAGVTLQSEATDEIQIIKQLLICRKLFVHDKISLGFKILKRVEKQAISISHFSLLNEIYHTYIQYSYSDLAPNQELLFSLLEKNQKQFVEQERLNMAYATIRKAFNRIEYEFEQLNLNELLQETFKRYEISDNRAYNFQSLYQIAQIADVTGAYRKDYHSIDLFFIDKVALIEGGPTDNEKFLIYHIDVLYIIANIYFRKRNFDKSLTYLTKMQQQMQRYNNRYYTSKLIQHNTLKALNLNYIGNNKAATELLNMLFIAKEYDFNSLLNPSLVRIMIHFQQGELREAKKYLSQFSKTDLWYEKHIGLEWTLNKNYTEILLHIELGNVDYVDSRINSLIRKYGEILNSDKSSNVLAFLRLVKKYYHNPEIITSNAFLKEIDATMVFKPKKQEDIILLSFYAWLKAKIENKPLYGVTIELAKL